jgi:ABC-type glutathione transport system ATPase component
MKGGKNMEREWSTKDIIDFFEFYEQFKTKKIKNEEKEEYYIKKIRSFLEKIKNSIDNKIEISEKDVNFKDEVKFKENIQYFNKLSYRYHDHGVSVGVYIARNLEDEKLSKSIVWGISTGKKEKKKILDNHPGFLPKKLKKKIRFQGYVFYCKDYIPAEEIKNYTEDDLVKKISEGLIEVYNFVKENFKKGHNPEKSQGDKLNSIIHAISTKPFLILAGVSGTGKTQIARIVAGGVAGERGETK